MDHLDRMDDFDDIDEIDSMINEDDDSDPLQPFRQELSTLVQNSRPLILMLTMLADDYRDRAAEIAEIIEHRLITVSQDLKLPTLYLIDSVCKNICNSLYVSLFQSKIVKLFCKTFENADEKNRMLMFKLRQTWNDVFKNEVMNELDVSVNKIDNGWPLPTTTNVDVPVSSSTRVIEQNKPTNKLLQTKSRTKSASNNDTNKQLLSKSNGMFSITRQQTELGLQKETMNLTNGHVRMPKNIINHHSNQSTIQLNTNKIPNKMSKRKKNKSATSLTKSIKKMANNNTDIGVTMVPSSDVFPLGSNHCVPVTKRSKPDPRQRNESASNVTTTTTAAATVKSRRRSRNSTLGTSNLSVTGQLSNRNRNSPNNSSKGDEVSSNQTLHTTIPAPNIFAQPQIYDCSNHSTPMLLPLSNNNGNFAMDRDYRREFDSFIREAQNKLNTGVISSADHEIMVREAERQLYEMQSNQASQFGTNPISQPQTQPFMPASMQQHPPPPQVQQSSQPCSALVEPNGSVVFYINQQLQRLYYINSTTAIVLKAHPDTPFDQLVSIEPSLLEPKQVFFSGMSTTVFIDPGTAHEQNVRLEFNDQMPVNFYLPGVTVPQRIMLGLPTRELIINGCPYQAAFGGPGVRVYLECDNKYHEFRLSDSKPLLKFSDDVRYDLWHQLVNEAKRKVSLPISQAPPSTTQQSSNYPVPQPIMPLTGANFTGQSQPPPQPPVTTMSNHYVPYDNVLPHSVPPPVVPVTNFNATSLDISGLFNKLSDFGLLKNSNTNTSTTATTTVTNIITKPKQPKSRNRKETKPKQYLTLDVSTLKSSNQFVIDQLYSGVQCTNCSLRFSDDALKDESCSDGKPKKSRYARHLDWHFRQNRREKSKPGSTSTTTSVSTVAHRRPWYYSIDLWTETSNHCAVCNEKFDLNWCEEEEEWRLKNAVRFTLNKGESVSQIYHPMCLKDYLIEQGKKTDENVLAPDDDLPVSLVDCNDDRRIAIPGLDCDLSMEVDSAEISTINSELESDSVHSKSEIETKDGDIISNQSEECVEEEDTSIAEPTTIKEEQNFEVNVIEYEIPIVTLNKSNDLNGDQTETKSSEEQIISVQFYDESTSGSNGTLSPKRNNNEGENILSNSKQSQNGTIAQPKRGGIVIKMKSSNSVASPNGSNHNETSDTGCVTLESNSLDNVESMENIDQKETDQPVLEEITSSVLSGNKNNDPIDISCDVPALEGDVDCEMNENKSDIINVPEQVVSMNGSVSSNESTKQLINMDSTTNVITCEEELNPIESESLTEVDPNYYMRGQEVSSLCAIM
ncbi:hypothetical protein BLOT_006223 [Blomia tropicalis]|nr:hypothetical protein BLOT_006223 [Blomia tropicalis]